MEEENENLLNDVKQITNIINDYLVEFEKIPKNGETFESLDYPILLHKKEVFLRLRDILSVSGLK